MYRGWSAVMAEAIATPMDTQGLARVGRKAAARRALTDPALFARRYLGLTLAPHQEEWACMGMSERRLVLLAPVRHGKSMVMGLTLPLMLIARDRNVRIIIASKTARLALDTVRHLGEHLRTNATLTRDYGAFWSPEQKWTDSQVQVIRSDPNLRDPTLTAVGVGGMVEGVGGNVAILDDVLDVEGASSEIERERTLEWFNGTLVPRLEPGGRVVVIGTPWHTEDLYARLGAREGYHLVRTPAIQNEAGGVVLWPARFPLGDLLTIRADIGSRAFSAKYQASPLSSEGVIFRAGWFRWVGHEDVPPGGRVFVGVDPALGKTEQADYFAAVAVSGDEATGKVYALGCYAHRGSLSDAYAGLRALCERVRPQKVIVEDVAFQWTALEQAPELRGLPLIPQPPEGRDKLARIRGTLEAAVEGGRLLFVRGAPGVEDLVAEMMSLPDSAHDDRTDALEIAARTLLGGGQDVALLEHGMGAIFHERRARWAHG